MAVLVFSAAPSSQWTVLMQGDPTSEIKAAESEPKPAAGGLCHPQVMPLPPASWRVRGLASLSQRLAAPGPGFSFSHPAGEPAMLDFAAVLCLNASVLEIVGREGG